MTRTVLVIEDNEQNRYLLTFLLEHRGYSVLSAVDGDRGLVLARTTTAHVILLDIQLPGMDGYAIASRLRAQYGDRAPPIIAVTSYAMPGDRERALEAGCCGYLEKPIDPATFVASMEEIVAAYAARPRKA